LILEYQSSIEELRKAGRHHIIHNKPVWMNKNVVPHGCKQYFLCIKKQYKKCLDQEIKEEVYMICVHLDLGRRKLLNVHMNVIYF